jgi:hypothetical protein
MNMKTLPETTPSTKATDCSHDFRASMDPLLQDHFRLLYLEQGEAVLSHEITCNGSSLQVTSNLHDALQYLRPIDGERIMWIDAVCINQTNPQERTAQVGIMKNIYSKSDHVVIWLGKDTDDDETAFAILE